MMLSPTEPRLRLLHISDEQAAYLMRWTRRIAVVGVFGYAIAEVGLLLGLSDAAHEALLKAVVLVVHIFLAIIVVQRRRTVRRWLRAPQDQVGVVAVLRNGVAQAWHWLAIILLATLWLVWAVEVPHASCRSSCLARSTACCRSIRMSRRVILGSIRALHPTTPSWSARRAR
jgi:hypothetical protein